MKKLILILSVLFVLSCSGDAEPIKYTLTTTVNPADSGTINPNGGTVDEGQQISVTASPAAEYVFDKWTGAASGSDKTVSVIMDSDKSVTANFVKKKYALTTSVEGEGTVSEKVIKAGLATDYNSGTIVELTATPSTFWVFSEWKGDLTGTDNPKQITIDKAKNVTAVFVHKIIGEWEMYFYEFDINGDGVNWDTRDMLAVYGYRNISIFKNGNKWDWIDGRGGSSSSNNAYDGDYEINGTTLLYTNSADQVTRTGYDLTFLCSNNVMRYRIEKTYNDGTKRNSFNYYNKKGFDPWTCDIDYYSN